ATGKPQATVAQERSATTTCSPDKSRQEPSPSTFRDSYTGMLATGSCTLSQLGNSRQIRNPSQQASASLHRIHRPESRSPLQRSLAGVSHPTVSAGILVTAQLARVAL